MKKMSIILLFILFGCETPKTQEEITANRMQYTESSQEQINKLKKPVILIAKQETWCCWNVTLKGGDGEVLFISAESYIAGSIGESRSIGDTIR